MCQAVGPGPLWLHARPSPRGTRSRFGRERRCAVKRLGFWVGTGRLGFDRARGAAMPLGMSGSSSRNSRMGDLAVRGPVRRDDLPVREQLSGVVEKDDAITQQAPTLLWVVSHRMGRLPIRRFGRWARRLMLALHTACVPPFICVQRWFSYSQCCSRRQQIAALFPSGTGVLRIRIRVAG